MNWTELKDCLLYWSGDKIIISIIEIAIIVFLFIAIIKNKKKRKGDVRLTVERGKTSWEYLTGTFSTLSLLSVYIVGNSEFCKGHKAIVILFNYLSLLYLCCFNNWFRNKLIGLYSKLRIEK